MKTRRGQAIENAFRLRAIFDALVTHLDLDPIEFAAVNRTAAVENDCTFPNVRQVLVDLGHDAEEIKDALMAAALALVGAEADIAFARMQLPGASGRTKRFMRRIGKLRGRVRAGKSF